MTVSELVGAVLTRPQVDPDAARTILARAWAIEGDLRPLPSERDQNYAVAIDGQDRFVLKLSNAAEDPGFLDLQQRAMARLVAAGVPCQVPVVALDGREVLDVGSEGRPTLARVLTWLPGRPLATIPPADRPEPLLRDLGRVMGRAATALGSLEHPAAHRPFQWEAGQGIEVIAAHAPAVVDPERGELLRRWVDRLRRLAVTLPGLRHGVIHNDANDHNVLVDDAGSAIAGLLDLGDAVHSVVANELAVAAAYAALGAPDPLAVVATIRSGFEETCPLRDDERGVVVELVALRLATSVALSAHQSRLDPEDTYLTVSEAPAWALLATLIEIEPADAATRVATNRP
jgi:hydroxylysine kinase